MVAAYDYRASSTNELLASYVALSRRLPARQRQAAVSHPGAIRRVAAVTADDHSIRLTNLGSLDDLPRPRAARDSGAGEHGTWGRQRRDAAGLGHPPKRQW